MKFTKCAAAGLSPALKACQTIHNVQQSLPSCITKVMQNAYAFAEGPTPYCPFLTGTHKRYVAGTHSLCSGFAVLMKKCVFTTRPEVSHHAAVPPPGGRKSLFSNYFRSTFSRAKKKCEKNILLRPKTALGANLVVFGPQLDSQNPPKICFVFDSKK